MVRLPFADRVSAGRLLAAEVAKLAPERPVVYALPRGGVPVAIEIAKTLEAPLDLLLVRKIGVPRYEEVAAGSIVDGERPDLILNEDIIRRSGMSRGDIEFAAGKELEEIERRRAIYLPGREPISAKNRTAILVDDGVATGASIRSAIAAVRRRDPKRIMVAVPVAARDTAIALRVLADDVVCLAAPEHFGAVGYYYDDFHQLEDAEVIKLLALAAPPDGSTGPVVGP